MKTEELQAFIDSKFQLPVVEGEDKVCSLDEAIRAVSYTHLTLPTILLV